MKKLIPIPFLLIPLAVAFFFSCKTSNENTPPENQFTWNYDGIYYRARLDTAYVSSIPWAPMIIASLGTSLFAPSGEIHISLTSFNAGNYVFTSGGSNVFNYTDPLGFNYNSNGGSLNITSSTSNYLAGNFSVSLNSGRTIAGNFNNVPVRP